MTFAQDPKQVLRGLLNFAFDSFELTTNAATQWVYTYYVGTGTDRRSVATVTIDFTSASKDVVLKVEKVLL
jgi:hypothetical protein